MRKYGNYIKLYIMFQVQNIKSLAQYRTDFLNARERIWLKLSQVPEPHDLLRVRNP